MADVKVEKTDPLRTTLSLLSDCTKEALRAIHFLGKAEETPIALPDMPVCHLDVGEMTYSVKITRFQCEQLKEAGTDYEDVLSAASSLLAGLSVQVTESATALMELLVDPHNLQTPATTSAYAAILLGCCTYSGGQTPNLSQSQCSHYNPTKWDPDNPTCTREKP
jgi:hypothetical protein